MLATSSMTTQSAVLDPVDLVASLRDLLIEAINVHIYDDGDEVDPTCSYHAAVREAETYLAANGVAFDPYEII